MRERHGGANSPRVQGILQSQNESGPSPWTLYTRRLLSTAIAGAKNKSLPASELTCAMSSSFNPCDLALNLCTRMLAGAAPPEGLACRKQKPNNP